jgi:hypothetical protein
MNITNADIRPWSSEDDITENTLIIIEDGQPKELLLEDYYGYADNEANDFEAFLNQVDELIRTDELYTFNEVTE